ncbi:hypothetical protein C8R42DRAFT_728634 [Lentinula raphanica]|nr:hypothetical protein C8R42DRAFT_728634 [Lentinula raphanica]
MKTIFSTEELQKIKQASHAGTRQIRDSDIGRNDFELLVHGGKKLHSSLINAIAAKIQEDSELMGESPSFCVFSSWLGPLVQGKAENALTGTFNMHVQHAVGKQVPGSTEDTRRNYLLARIKWVIPLCIEETNHWVLTWVDFGLKEIGMFDSIPELGSSFRAEPMLLCIVDRLFALMNEPLLNWAAHDCPFSRKIYTPTYLELQNDGWSCGLFTLMALSAIREGLALDSVGNSGLDDMRREGIRMLMELLLIRPTTLLVNSDTDSDEVETITVVVDEVITTMAVEDKVEMAAEDEVEAVMAVEDKVEATMMSAEGKGSMVGMALEQKLKDEIPQIQTSSNTKRPRPDASEEATDSYETSDSKSNLRKNKRVRKYIRRAPRRSASERQKELENDEYVSSIINDREVKCAGCGSHIRLGKPFELKNWVKHQGSCPRITLKRTVRVQTKPQKPVVVPSSNGITNYFQSRVDPAISTKPNGGTAQAVVKKPQITMKKVAAEPSIQLLFSKSNAPVSKPTFPAPKAKTLCVHLKGAKYDDYIHLTSTRTFGGISPLQFGLFARRLFPYKDFPKLKSEDACPTHDRPPVPPDGVPHSNVARWEVNLAGGFIKSTQCEQQTLNPDSICDKCITVANDDSLKRAVRKKRHEASLPEDERLEKALLREKHASLSSDRMQQIQRRFVNDLLSDKILFDITESLKTGDAHDCFLRLWKHACAGNLGKHQRVVDICEALDNRIGREASDNPKLICGIRYTQNVINFMMMMRSYGHNSHRQYTMFTSVFGGPSSRHLQTLGKEKGG